MIIENYLNKLSHLRTIVVVIDILPTLSTTRPTQTISSPVHHMRKYETMMKN